MNRKLRIGLVGAGRMGAHHSRIVQQSAHAELAAVVDLDPIKAQLIAGSSGATATTDFRSAFGCDAVIVATTAETHWEVAKPLLRAGVPLLIEKPLAPTVDEAEALVELSAAHDVPMMCGFVERFNAVVRTAEKLMSESGRALHFVSLRHSPAEPLVPTSVVHDLLIHDADLALKL
ncbi:MAG: Gfo/Idh/MocA family protein, partial [Actinomycetota bacterium]